MDSLKLSVFFLIPISGVKYALGPRDSAHFEEFTVRGCHCMLYWVQQCVVLAKKVVQTVHLKEKWSCLSN